MRHPQNDQFWSYGRPAWHDLRARWPSGTRTRSSALPRRRL